MFTETLNILWNYRQGFCSGLLVTMQLAIFIWGVGIAAGTLFGLAAEHYPYTVGRMVRAFASVMAAIPAIVLLFWAYFPLQLLLSVEIDPFWTAAWSLAVLNTALVANIVRGQLADFPTQFQDAATVCGLSPTQTFLHITIPLVARQTIPALLLLQVSMLHLTLFTSLISVEDVFRVAQRINATIYRPVEIYSAVAVLFVSICLPLQLLAAGLQRRYGTTLRER